MSQKYFNQKAQVWDELIAEKDSAKLRALISRLDIKPESRVLDVGTGTGVFLPYLLAKVGKFGKLVCLDYAEEMLNKARGKYALENVAYICADISDSNLKSSYFDAIVCYSSFPHFTDKARALSEIYRLLIDGGKLYICHSSSRQAINQIHQQIPEVCSDLIPDENEMRQLLSAAGLCAINICDDAEQYLVSAIK